MIVKAGGCYERPAFSLGIDRPRLDLPVGHGVHPRIPFGDDDVKALLAEDGEFLRALARAALQEVLEAEMTEDIKDFAFVIDGTPEIHPPAGTPNHHFIQVPSIAWAGAPPPQPPRDHRAELQHPAPDGWRKRSAAGRSATGCRRTSAAERTRLSFQNSLLAGN